MSTPSQGVAAPDGERAMVATVIDGDTFQLTDGRKVRVLGIDSCEDTGKNKTPGRAQATTQAGVLDDNQVILTAEPGGRR
jgi:micrococcal nuclease